MGPIERGGAGGGIAAVLNSLYQAEILTSHELVNQIIAIFNSFLNNSLKYQIKLSISAASF
jgi:glycerate kinase